MSKKKFLILNNKKSGKSPEKKELLTTKIISLFDEHNISTEIFDSEYPRHMEEFVSKQSFENFDAVIGLGGDGTSNEIISGIQRRENPTVPPVGFIPLGTGNDFLRSLGNLNPMNWVNKIVKGETRKVDIIEISTKDKTFFSQLLTGWGVFYDGAVAAEKYRFLGPLKYTAGAIESLLKSKKRKAKITVNGEVYEDDFWGAMICNTQFIGGGLLMARDAKIDDGIFEFFLVKNVSRIKLIFLFIQLALKIPLSPSLVNTFKTTSVEISPEESEPINIDGDFMGTTPLKASIKTKSYDLIC